MHTIRHAYGPKQKVKLKTPGKGRAKQAFKDECNINKIMARYQKTGVVDHVNTHQPSYGYVPAIQFREALELVAQSREEFAELPSEIRKRFDNNPADFLTFCENADNRSEMALLGLLAEPETPAESPSPQSSDSATAPLPPSPATPTPE